jgi:hypothetical protein
MGTSPLQLKRCKSLPEGIWYKSERRIQTEGIWYKSERRIQTEGMWYKSEKDISQREFRLKECDTNQRRIQNERMWYKSEKDSDWRDLIQVREKDSDWRDLIQDSDWSLVSCLLFYVKIKNFSLYGDFTITAKTLQKFAWRDLIQIGEKDSDYKSERRIQTEGMWYKSEKDISQREEFRLKECDTNRRRIQNERMWYKSEKDSDWRDLIQVREKDWDWRDVIQIREGFRLKRSDTSQREGFRLKGCDTNQRRIQIERMWCRRYAAYTILDPSMHYM